MRARLAAAVAEALDVETVFGAAGLALLFAGLSLYDVALAMTVVGALLLGGAVAGVVWKQRRLG